ncbi:hypothetical protein GR255_23300 [Mycobacterium tuberculosis]|nr:hypothetical protein [Mycobacterium tuberculosis]
MKYRYEIHLFSYLPSTDANDQRGQEDPHYQEGASNFRTTFIMKLLLRKDKTKNRLDNI